MSESIRLNLGAGPNELPGYFNIDKSYETNTFQRGSCEVYPLAQFLDESVDEIRASHILEHFSHRQTADVLREWVRVLKPGGVLKVAVPNFEWITNRYRDGDEINVQGYLMGGHVDKNDHHGAIFDREGLEAAFESLGLVDIKSWQSEINDCAALPVSLNLQGTKPGASAIEQSEEIAAIDPVHPLIATHPDARFAQTEIKSGDVSAVMTAPRLGFTAFMHCAISALGMLDIPLKQSGGVFWNQGITKVLEAELAAGTKYALVLDFDTIFDWRDVQTLYGIMERRPDIDALCPVQMRREMTVPLITVKGPDGVNVSRLSLDALAADVMPVATAHFGLTMIRVSALADMPRPWFAEQADEDGGWGDGRVDADIAFWNTFAASGRKLYQANRVAVGHLELIVTWPDERLTPKFQYSSDYHAGGKPGGIWK
jgi:hypothetical protein